MYGELTSRSGFKPLAAALEEADAGEALTAGNSACSGIVSSSRIRDERFIKRDDLRVPPYMYYLLSNFMNQINKITTYQSKGLSEPKRYLGR